MTFKAIVHAIAEILLNQDMSQEAVVGCHIAVFDIDTKQFIYQSLEKKVTMLSRSLAKVSMQIR